MIGLIAMDLDNTALVDGRLPEGNKEAILRAVDAGVMPVVATGRTLSGIPADIRNLRGFKYAITCNGATIWDMEEQRVLSRYALDEETVRKLLSIGEKYHTTYEIFTNGSSYIDRSYYEDPGSFGAPEHLREYIRFARIPVDDIRAFIHEHEEEIENFVLTVKGDEMHRKVAEAVLRTCPEVTMVDCDAWWVEVLSGQSCKGKALARLAEILQVERSTIAAFGDGDNDIGLLENAGLAVAMGNASEGLKKVADHITKDVKEDGLAYGIGQILEGRWKAATCCGRQNENI